jgi:hypothetical protein
MAVAEHQPILENGGPVFEWSPGITVMDEDEAPVIVDDLVEDAHKGIVIEDDDEEDDAIGADEATEDDVLEDEDPVPAKSDKVFPLHNDVKDARSNDGDGNNEVDNNDDGIAEDPMAAEEDELESARHNLRPNWEPTYNKRFTHSMDNPASRAMPYSSYSKERV